MPVKTNDEWIEWGNRDPLFGVASIPGKEAGSENQWTEKDFYLLGESEWLVFHKYWSRYGLNPDSFIEIGCGAGRITKQLAKTFKSGHAIDISMGMMALAKRNVFGDVQWHLTNGTDVPVSANSVEAAFSCEVFQHLPSVEYGYRYFEKISKILKPGGTMMVHLPMYRMPDHVSLKAARFLDFLYRRLAVPLQNIKVAIQRLNMHRGGRPPMNGVDYEMQELIEKLSGFGFQDIEIATFVIQRGGLVRHFVLARKPV